MLGARFLEGAALLALTVAVAAVPVADSFMGLALHKRQEAVKSGLTDIDIMNFALFAEHLEAAFYRNGFQQIPDSQFQALGLNEANISALKKVGQTEADHVSLLLSAIAGAGFKPVEPCQYNFGFTDAASMVATAKILEAVGVSAYLGAAPLIQSPAILSVAASIATIEARHQTFIRVAAGEKPIPTALDTPLSVRAVFTLAAPFVVQCPAGSNLAIQPFPSIQLAPGSTAAPGSTIILQDKAQSSEAKFCAFVESGNASFVDLVDGRCDVPISAAGEVYMLLTKEKNTIDDVIVAGPVALGIS